MAQLYLLLLGPYFVVISCAVAIYLTQYTFIYRNFIVFIVIMLLFFSRCNSACCNVLMYLFEIYYGVSQKNVTNLILNIFNEL